MQWQPLCAADPTPGDPDEVEAAGRHYSSMAAEIEDQVARMKNLVDSTLAGAYVQTLTDAAGGLGEELGQASGRYRQVGGTLQEHWAPALRDFQDEAEHLRRKAAAAGAQMFNNRALEADGSLGGPPAGAVVAAVAAAKARQGRYDDASGALFRAQSALVDLTERRDAAAAKVAGAISGACDDHVANDGWADFLDLVDSHHDQISKACKRLGEVAMAACVVALFVPGLNVVEFGVLTAVAVGATSASLVGHSMLAASGYGSWWDVGMDAFALATFGAGRFLGPGVKVFGKEFGGALERLTAETKTAGAEARGITARAQIQANVKADVAQARQRLVEGVSNRVGRGVRLEVKAIRAQGEIDKVQAFNTARDAYAAQTTTTSWAERLTLGGGDTDIATLRKTGLDASAGFSDTSKVGLAAAKADAQYAKAVIPMRVSNLTSAWSVFTDHVDVKWYDDWRHRFMTKEGGTL
jgi:hypothetical protein